MSFPFVQPYFGLGNSLQTAQAAGGGIGGWTELARTTLGSVNADITVSSLPDKRYYMYLVDGHRTSVTVDGFVRLGNGSVDTGSNYSRRLSPTGTSDSTLINQTGISDWYPSTSDTNFLTVGYISNLSGKEKLIMDNKVTQNTAGASTAPNRIEQVGKWINTSNPLDIVNFNASSNTFASGSEVVVLGWDQADTHTTNFWEELASVSGTGSSTEISSGTISAKKYLWLQMWNDTGATSYTSMTFNNDTASNYARRTSEDGTADSTAVSEAAALIPPNVTGPHFMNIFIINNSANEKLCIFSNVGGSSAGAATAPLRSEGVFKWANTSAQITEIDMTSSSGNYTSNSILKVWGSD